MNENKLACACHNVTYAMVKKAAENGAKSVDELAAATGAGTACGKCKEFLAYLLRDCIQEETRL